MPLPNTLNTAPRGYIGDFSYNWDHPKGVIGAVLYLVSQMSLKALKVAWRQQFAAWVRDHGISGDSLLPFALGRWVLSLPWDHPLRVAFSRSPGTDDQFKGFRRDGTQSTLIPWDEVQFVEKGDFCRTVEQALTRAGVTL